MKGPTFAKQLHEGKKKHLVRNPTINRHCVDIVTVAELAHEIVCFCSSRCGGNLKCGVIVVLCLEVVPPHQVKELLFGKHLIDSKLRVEFVWLNVQTKSGPPVTRYFIDWHVVGPWRQRLFNFRAHRFSMPICRNRGDWGGDTHWTVFTTLELPGSMERAVTCAFSVHHTGTGEVLNIT